ncbi:esterase-like activity of phytase family protein [Campylobacter sputorum]|uniref:esterase-like activity of phytase family protein n=1 Tax=Campylobacter sputorum TaxID=206 RepID=UPI0013747B5B|nr:esterase-like activity of phytase family protein [Campylobacter sputorum]ASM36159.1 putative esterase-like protein [Campylobacter sputorum bv. faecalis CCUG 20703]
MKKGVLLSLALASFCFGLEFSSFESNMEFNNKFDFPFHPSIGYGSGAFHKDNDDKNVIYTITDRGINIDCKETKNILKDEFCKKGKVFPYPEFTPSIYKLKIKDGGIEILETITLKTSSGKNISGVSNPQTEKSYSMDKKELVYDVNGIDSEALAISNDGYIYIADEYGPSIFVTDLNGIIKERWVPKGVAKSLDGADYKVVENFPQKLRQRQLNRGFEAVSLSKDDKFVYTILQSPFEGEIDTKIVPFYAIDRSSGEVLQTLNYPLDDIDSFKLDSKKKKRKQNDVKVSEMATLPNGDLAVLERVSKTTKFYKINPKNVQNNTLKKELIFSTDDYKGFPSKIESIAVINENEWILINDNDFGITGDKTKIIKVKF